MGAMPRRYWPVSTLGLTVYAGENLIMNKIISLALLAGGIVLIIFGVQATNSFTSDVSKFFTGSPTNKAVWMLIGGIVAVIAGLATMGRSSKRG